jgi:hypothetical protein
MVIIDPYINKLKGMCLVLDHTGRREDVYEAMQTRKFVCLSYHIIEVSLLISSLYVLRGGGSTCSSAPEVCSNKSKVLIHHYLM